MTKHYRMALMAGLLGAAAQAHGQLYVCADAQGHKTYTDKRAGAHCQLLDLPGAMTEPPRKTAPRPATQAVATAAPAAGAFPKVDGAEQRARDLDRR